MTFNTELEVPMFAFTLSQFIRLKYLFLGDFYDLGLGDIWVFYYVYKEKLILLLFQHKI